MNRNMELAMKVMELAKDFTHWDFKLIQAGENFLVGTTVCNQRGQEMNVYYKIKNRKVQLDVFVSNFEYDSDFVDKKANELAQKFDIGVAGIYGEMLILESWVSLELFEREMHVIVRERMTDMMGAMTEIINYGKHSRK